MEHQSGWIWRGPNDRATWKGSEKMRDRSEVFESAYFHYNAPLRCTLGRWTAPEGSQSSVPQSWWCPQTPQRQRQAADDALTVILLHLLKLSPDLIRPLLLAGNRNLHQTALKFA